MNIQSIFQNAYKLTRHYRALWIFGVILALTTISFGSIIWSEIEQEQWDRTIVQWELSVKDQRFIEETFGLRLPLSYDLKVDDLRMQYTSDDMTEQEWKSLLRKVQALLGGALALLLVNNVLRYTSETALIRMVDEKQRNERTVTARQGWRLGFSSAAVRLFLIDLLMVPTLLTLTVLVYLPVILPALVAASGTPAGISLGVLLALASVLVASAFIIAMWGAGIVTLKLARRACCLEGLGVFASIWRGFRLMRAQWQGIGVVWVAAVGLELAYPLLVAPLAVLLLAAGVLSGGLLALAVGGLLSLAAAKATAWTVAGVVGFVLLALVVVVPMSLADGLRETFLSALWTLAFRQASEAPQPASRPAEAGPALEGSAA